MPAVRLALMGNRHSAISGKHRLSVSTNVKMSLEKYFRLISSQLFTKSDELDANYISSNSIPLVSLIKKRTKNNEIAAAVV